MSDDLAISVSITRYRVSCLDALPDDDPDKSVWDITVEERSRDRWAVVHRGFCLRRDGKTAYESNPSSRTDRFKRAYRYDLDTALAIARKYAPKVTVYGMTAAQLVDWKARPRSHPVIQVKGGDTS
jgi:hypothetical protein